jgi:hypothetical protein
MCSLRGIFHFWICNSQLSFDYQMRCQTSMRVGRVVGVSVVNRQPYDYEAVLGEGTHGPSVQVKTCENPHDFTCSSGSASAIR